MRSRRTATPQTKTRSTPTETTPSRGRETGRGGSQGILLCLFLLTLGLVGGAAQAANECRVRYSWATGIGSSDQNTVYINKGSTRTINKAGAIKVDNLKTNPVRVYRTGIGSYVDLDNNQSDPSIAVYPPGVTLQKVKCLEGSTSGQTPTQQAVNAMFSAFTNFTSPVLNQLNSWKSQAQQAANKTATAWGSCPSPGAQSTYNQIKSRRDSVQDAIDDANDMKDQAEAALSQCKAAFNNSQMCNTAYNTLALHGAISSLETAKSGLNAALTALKNLKCPNGCNQSASLKVPSPNLTPGGYWDLRNPGWIRGRVCTRVDLGSVGVNTSALSSGNVNSVIQAQPPTCTRSQRFAICTNYDLVKLLALLKKLKLVPPNVGKISVDVPNMNLKVPTGLQKVACQDPLRVCVPSGNVTISLNEGAPLFNGSYNSCASQQTLTCKNPPFGVGVATQNVSIPDVTKAKISWTGRRPGSIVLDLSRRDFQGICLGRGRTSLKIPKPPQFSLKQTTVNLPFLCTQPNWVDVVANP